MKKEPLSWTPDTVILKQTNDTLEILIERPQPTLWSFSPLTAYNIE